MAGIKEMSKVKAKELGQLPLENVPEASFK